MANLSSGDSAGKLGAGICEVTGVPDSPLVVSVPHAGTEVPASVRRRLAVPVDRVADRMDDYVWDLAQSAVRHGTVVRALIARAVVDLNRSGAVSPIDLSLDPGQDNERLVRLYDDRGESLWRARVGRPPLSRTELEERVDKYHEPYHAALEAALKRAGVPCLLVDLHTMTDPVLDLVVGDFRGRSTGAGLCEGRVVPFFVAQGLRVGYAGPRSVDRQGRPVPEAAIRQSGGFITGRYGDPGCGRYALQLEVSREACGRDLARMQGILDGFWAFAAGELIAGLQDRAQVAGGP